MSTGRSFLKGHGIEYQPSRYVGVSIFVLVKYFNTHFLALIRGLLTVNPANRMTLNDAFQHPWCMRLIFFSLHNGDTI
jgi:hypothetical protein